MSAARIFWAKDNGKWVAKLRLFSDDFKRIDEVYPVKIPSEETRYFDGIIRVGSREMKSIAIDNVEDIVMVLSLHWKSLRGIRIED